jgi:Papain-like cysteine protease AvrRpt2
LAEIEKEIESGVHVIACLKMPYAHSVIITGISRETLTVYYNDPQKGKLEIEMGKFIDCWQGIDKVLIKTKIDETQQRTMTDFVGSVEQRN